MQLSHTSFFFFFSFFAVTHFKWRQFSTRHIIFSSYAMLFAFSLSFPILAFCSLSSTRKPYPATHVTVASGTIFSSRSYLARRIKFVLMTWESLSPTILSLQALLHILYSCTDGLSESQECACECSHGYTRHTMNTVVWYESRTDVNACSHRHIQAIALYLSQWMISIENAAFYLITQTMFLNAIREEWAVGI